MTIPVDKSELVFARSTQGVTLRSGAYVRVYLGQHWLRSDPVVHEHPEMFTDDARYGLMYTVEPEGYDAPPGGPVEMASSAPGEKRSIRRG